MPIIALVLVLSIGFIFVTYSTYQSLYLLWIYPHFFIIGGISTSIMIMVSLFVMWIDQEKKHYEVSRTNFIYKIIANYKAKIVIIFFSIIFASICLSQLNIRSDQYPCFHPLLCQKVSHRGSIIAYPYNYVSGNAAFLFGLLFSVLAAYLIKIKKHI